MERGGNNALSTIALDRPADFFSGGNAEPYTATPIFSDINYKKGRYKGFAFFVSAAEIIIFL